MKRFFAGTMACVFWLAAAPAGPAAPLQLGDSLTGIEAHRKLNFVLILCDGLGYSDTGPFGGPIPTPALDRMAREGLVATDCYSPAVLGTPAHAALLTGRYPLRTGLAGMIGFNDNRVLPLTEKTIASLLKPDYVTGLFGEWSLGHAGATWLPTNYGFDVFFGIPYGHDLQPISLWDADAQTGAATYIPADLPNLQQQLYARAEDFIDKNHDQPFFVELALSSPHPPEHPNADYKGGSAAGPYGDCVREIDTLVGRMLNKLVALKLEHNTVVIFTSNSSAWFQDAAKGARGRAGSASYDGGYRVPFLAWSPGQIKAGSKTTALISSLDLLPTFCSLAERPLPPDLELDGRDVSGVLTKNEPSPREEILLFKDEKIVAIRTPKWKYATEAFYRGPVANFEREDGTFSELLDMSGGSTEELRNVAASNPEVVTDLRNRLQEARKEFAVFAHSAPPRPPGTSVASQN
jgi:arylsulfatase A